MTTENKVTEVIKDALYCNCVAEHGTVLHFEKYSHGSFYFKATLLGAAEEQTKVTLVDGFFLVEIATGDGSWERLDSIAYEDLDFEGVAI